MNFQNVYPPSKDNILYKAKKENNTIGTVKNFAHVSFFSIITRALAFVFKILVVRLVGTYTLGSFQLAMSVFGTLLALTSSGIPLVVSRKTSAFSALNRGERCDQTATGGAAVGLALSLLSAPVVLPLLPAISRYLNNSAVASLVRLMLPALFVSAVYSACRGSLWGKQRFTLYGVNETAEEVLTILCFLACFFLVSDKVTALGLAYLFSFILAAILSLVFYFKAKGKVRFSKQVTLEVFKETAPITSMRLLGSLAGFVILFILPKKLAAFGLSEKDAVSLIGLASGVVMPLLFVPSTLISSLCIVSVPQIATDFKLRRYQKIENGLSSSLFFSFALSLCIIPLYVCFGTEITSLVFGEASAGAYLSAAAIAIFFMGQNQTVSSALNACDGEKSAFISSAVSFFLSFLIVFFLTDKLGIFAYVLSLTLQPLCALLLNSLALSRRLNRSFRLALSPLRYLLPLASSLLAANVFKALTKNLPDVLSLLLGGALVALFALFLLYVLYDFSPFSFLSNQKRLLSKGRLMYNQGNGRD